MNILLIPSWYPYPAAPLNGIFIREQIALLAQQAPQHQFFVSLHGQLRWLLSPRNPSLLRQLQSYYRTPRQPQLSSVTANFHEILTPTLEWSERLWDGNLAGLLASHEKNLQTLSKKSGPIDLIHAHVTYPAGWLALQLARRHHMPFVITEHMGPFPFLKPRFLTDQGTLTPWLQEPLQAASRVVAVSQALKTRIESFGIERVQVIPNLVDEKVFRPAATPHPQQIFTFFTLASMLSSKGIPELLEAIALLPHNHARFLIGGNGPEQQSFQQKAQTLGISERIQWLGSLNRIQASEYYQLADAFVLPSRIESFGTVYIEALATGKPVIATHCGGPEDIVNSQNGYLVPLKDPQALAQAMQSLIRNIEAYHPASIRQDCLARFSSKVVCQQILDLYHQIHD